MEPGVQDRQVLGDYAALIDDADEWMKLIGKVVIAGG